MQSPHVRPVGMLGRWTVTAPVPVVVNPKGGPGDEAAGLGPGCGPRAALVVSQTGGRGSTPVQVQNLFSDSPDGVGAGGLVMLLGVRATVPSDPRRPVGFRERLGRPPGGAPGVDSLKKRIAQWGPLQSGASLPPWPDKIL